MGDAEQEPGVAPAEPPVAPDETAAGDDASASAVAAMDPEEASVLAALSEDADALIAKFTSQLQMQSGDVGDMVDDLIPGTSAHYLPRYQMPSISSILPEYSNSEAEYIRHAFAQGSYNNIHNLPTYLKVHEVNKMRSALMEAVRKPLPGPPNVTSGVGSTKGLFQDFEYIPSQYNLEDQLDEEARLKSHAQRMMISDQDWNHTGNFFKKKHEDGFKDNSYFPYSSNPYDAAKDMVLRHLWMEEQKILDGPWHAPAGEKVLSKPPGPLLRDDIVKNLHSIVTEDWEEAEVHIYENSEGHWVIRFKLETVDSETGLLTYMNVMTRTNVMVTRYCMTRVTEHWNVKPGDGYIYFTLRPAWVKKKRTEDAYTPTNNATATRQKSPEKGKEEKYNQYHRTIMTAQTAVLPDVPTT